MFWSTKVKAFCPEAYFANNSYKVVQASFQRKFQCRHAPPKSRIFDWIQKFREYGTVQNLIHKVWGILILVGLWVLGRKETLKTSTILHDVRKFASNAMEVIWSIFWREHDLYAKWLQWLKLCGMIVHSGDSRMKKTGAGALRGQGKRLGTNINVSPAW